MVPPQETEPIAAADGLIPPLPPPVETPGSSRRFLFIDGLRGVAALLVLVYHFTVAGSFSPAFARVLPAWLFNAILDCRQGVAIFFVISGFVIAYTLRGVDITPGYFARYVVRRSLRLDPPYWVVVFLEILLLAAVNRLTHDRAALIPTTRQTLLNLFYLQGLTQNRHVLVVSWTLCMEVQFYLLYTVMWGAWRGSTLRVLSFTIGVGFTALAIASVATYDSMIPALPGLFLVYWFEFFTGVLLCWCMFCKLPTGTIWAWLTVLEATQIFKPDVGVQVTVATTLLMYVAFKTGRMQTWLGGRVAQFFGTISYSLYLVHVPVGARITNLGVRLNGQSAGWAIAWVTIAASISVLCAAVLYRVVELPAIRWSQRLKARRITPGRPDAIADRA